MPKRNMIKEYGEGEFYHCYNRGVNKQKLFYDSDDFAYFLSLFKRHLSSEPSHDKTRRLYPHYADEVDLVAYCLMSNHYHLLFYLKQVKGIERVMRSVMTAYSVYFNKKYDRTGKLFEGHFLASRITSDSYFWHVSEYIHLNPLDIKKDPMVYPYSSVAYFRGDKSAEWLHPEHIVTTATDKVKYTEGLSSSQDYHELQHMLRYQLANNLD